MTDEKTKLIISPFRIFTKTLMRFYLVLYIVLITAGLIVSIVVLTDILTKPQVKSTTFIDTLMPANVTPQEQAIMTKLDGLEISQKNYKYQNVQLQKPNPFLEQVGRNR